MGLFSGYNKWRRMQQALSARGRSAPTIEEAGAAISPQISQEAAEEEGLGREMGYKMGEKELGSRAARFADTVGLARKRLEFMKQRAAVEAGLGRQQLGLAAREVRQAKRIGPYALGLGAAGIGLSAWEAAKQRERDAQIRQRLDEILGIKVR